MIIRSARVVLPDGVRPASIHISGGRITRVGAYDDQSAYDDRSAKADDRSAKADESNARPDDRGAKALAERYAELIDFGDLVVSPGLVDTHVHVNEPGRTDWEGFDTATRAAAAGGVTAIVDMPLNSVPATTTVAALEAKRAAARGRVHVDVGFWGGVVPDNAGELDALVEAGVRGFKCFLVPSGVPEFGAVDEADLRLALSVLARCDVPMLVHAEAPQVIAECGMRNADSNPQSNPQSAIRNPQYAMYLASRPPRAEVEAIRMTIRLSRALGARVHIVHVACAEAVREIADAKAAEVPITAETCPHYLTFAAEDIPDRATELKCAPPIREARHRESLWDGLRRGALDMIATDHSPAPPAMKCPGDFVRAWGGIASLELSLAAVWTAGTSRELEVSTLKSQLSAPLRVESSELRVDPCSLAFWMSERPAALAGLGARKGRIATGFDADLVVWDPEASFVVEPSSLQQRHKLTPYAGRRLHGRVQTTFVRGARVWDRNQLVCAHAGQLL
ncbi:MAG: allantoinase AllB [Acidobacteria bacterium]|nr:MAG: allantoinase AllB [Acidobacteriota bacterium]